MPRSFRLSAFLTLLLFVQAAVPAQAATHTPRANHAARDYVDDGSYDDSGDAGWGDSSGSVDCVSDVNDDTDPGYDNSGDACTGDGSGDGGDPTGDGSDPTGDGSDPTVPAAPAVPAPLPLPAPVTPLIPRIPEPQQPKFIHLHANGKVWVSPQVPRTVREVIAAANRIAKLPYRYGGGHGSFLDKAYDCSGSVSYALHGGGLLDATLTSGMLEHWGAKGKGRWITVYANAGHTFMMIAGMRFDTGARAQWGSRWMIGERWTRGYVVRHPPGL